jgi:hypothetical protein
MENLPEKKTDETTLLGPEGNRRYVCEPLPGEGPKAFSAFVRFLTLGEKRTIENVATVLNRSNALIARWSRKYEWQRRLLAWNQKILEGQQEEAEILAREGTADWAKRQRELRNREWEIANKALQLCSRWIDKLLAQKRGKVSIQDATRLLEVASKVGRLATGLATERGELSGLDGEPIRVELSAALQKVYGSTSAVISVAEGQNAPEVPLCASAGRSGNDSQPKNLPMIEAPKNVPDSDG